MGVSVELLTNNNLQYQFYPVASGYIRFKVRAPKDAHIALTTGPDTFYPMYEIFIGGWNNTKSVIRRNRTKPDKVEVDTPDILSKNEFRDFYIRWDGGKIGAYRGGENIPFMSWEDPEPFSIKSVGVCTGWGATGTWKFETDDEAFDTPDKLEYNFRPVTDGYLDFDYCGPDSCDICLTSSAEETTPMYEVILGGWENTKSVLRLNREKPDKVVVSTPGITSVDKFKKLLLEWHNGRVVLRDRMENEVLMEWFDDAPFPISFFGVRSGYGTTAQWRINHYFKDPLPSNIINPEFSNGKFVWVDVPDSRIPPGAVVGGKDQSGELIYVVRARHQSDLLPGMLLPSQGIAYVPWNGLAHKKRSYQMLVGGPASWMAGEGDDVPLTAVPAGETESGEPLFVGRVYHKGSVIPGKVHQTHKTCYISHEGQEKGFKKYEVLAA